MKVSQAFPSTFLKADDLNGQNRNAVISKVEMETLGDDHRLVLSFEKTDKRMVCNKTNANRIAVLYGEETDDWVGKTVTIGSEFVEFQGRTVKGLRIKLPSEGTMRKIVTEQRQGYKLSTTAPAEPAPAEFHSDDIPF